MGFAIAAGVAVAGAAIASNSSAHATSAEATAAANANSTQQGQYNQTRSDQAPWRAAGTDALSQIQAQQGYFNQDFNAADMQADPGYDFRLQEGQKAIERSAAARGGLNSGATMKALDSYSQGEASQEYQSAYNRFNEDRTNRFNRLASVAGIGQQATNQTDAAGQSAANQISSNQVSAGNAQAANSVSQGNNINNAMSSGMNTWLQYQMMNRYAPYGTNPAGTSSPY